MRPRVTAILVAGSSPAHIARTLGALAAQKRPPDSLIGVDLGADSAARAALAAQAAVVVSLEGPASFPRAVQSALAGLGPAKTENEWLWLLDQDSAPFPDALARLVEAVEVSPSLAIAAPKRMRWDRPDVIHRFGQTVTRLGRTVDLVRDELDQGQHDSLSDVLAADAPGMLIRRSVLEAVGGLDPALSSVDAGLDLSIRTRLHGSRIALVPAARVSSDDAASTLRPRRGLWGAARRAQLHRRMVYAPSVAVALHWLTLIPLAVVRAIVHLVGKRPERIPGEFGAAFSVAFAGASIRAARRRLAAARRLGWASIAPLRLTRGQARQRRIDQRGDEPVDQDRVSFLAGGGLLAVIVAAAIGIVWAAPLIGTSAVNGGAILPLGGFDGLWQAVRSSERSLGVGSVGPADPFSYLLAALGSLWPAEPSVVIVVLYCAALGAATLGAWFAARLISGNAHVVAIVAVLWALAPMFLGALADGRLGAALAHLLLPWLLVAGSRASRSWSAAAASSLLLAAIIASAPSLGPALGVIWVLWLLVRVRGWFRLILVPLPTLALFAPLVIGQYQRGTPLALLADPGVPLGYPPAPAWQLALGFADAGFGGLAPLLAGWGLPALVAAIVVAALLLPVGLSAVLALVVTPMFRAVAMLLIALIGLLTAFAAGSLSLVTDGSSSVFLWPGAGLSLYWLGLLGAAVAALSTLDRTAYTVIAAVGAAAVAVPLLGSLLVGSSLVTPGDDRRVPAIVAATAQRTPGIGTLVLAPQPDGGLGVSLVHGAGETLDSQSTFVHTERAVSARQRELAELATALVSNTRYDPAALDALGIGFVLLAPDQAGATPEARSREESAARSLNSAAAFSPVSATELGTLWRGIGTVTPPAAAPAPALPWQREILTAQLVILLLALLTAIPGAPRREPDGGDRGSD